MEIIEGIVPSNRVRTTKITRLDGCVIESYLALPSRASFVSRALDKLGIVSTIPSVKIKSFIPKSSVVGQAITVRNIPENQSPYKRWIQRETTNLGERDAHFLAEKGDVMVIDGASVYPASCLGPISARMAKYLGISGIVVNGCVTGVSGIIDNNLPVWALGGTTITGHQRVETIEINGPIGIMGVRIEPGDLVIGDESGITVVPFYQVKEVLEQAQKLVSLSSRVRQCLESGADRSLIRKELKKQMDKMPNI